MISSSLGRVNHAADVRLHCHSLQTARGSPRFTPAASDTGRDVHGQLDHCLRWGVGTWESASPQPQQDWRLKQDQGSRLPAQSPSRWIQRDVNRGEHSVPTIRVGKFITKSSAPTKWLY